MRRWWVGFEEGLLPPFSSSTETERPNVRLFVASAGPLVRSLVWTLQGLGGPNIVDMGPQPLQGASAEFPFYSLAALRSPRSIAVI